MNSMHGIPFERCETVRVGFIGVGGRGRSLLREMVACDGVAVTAIADSSADAVARAVDQVTTAGHPTPATFTDADSWRHLLEVDLDLVLVATPWTTHTPYAVAVMEAGKHVAVEVPVATTLEECWQLVETSERTRRHCVMLENCCYDYWETLVKRMVFAGLLGEITHAECAYFHDLRQMLLEDRSEGLWRRRVHIERNGNLYPTHGLGPVAQILGIGTDDQFDYLVSMSSREKGLSEYRDGVLPAGDPKRSEIYRAGDMNSSLIRTKQGRTILLQHDSHTPRPYERNFLISGSKGLFRDYPPRLYLDGVGEHEAWLPLEEYKAQWEDPLWTNLGELARNRGGHGGMDFIMIYRLLQTVQQGLPPDIDVYDAVEWSAPGPLSEQSVANRSRPVDFPNFRRYQEGVIQLCSGSHPKGGLMSEELPTPPQPPAGVIAYRDLAYVANGHERQKLDLYLPAGDGESGAVSSQQEGKNFPLIIWVHGGAFRVGSKEGNPDNPPPFHYATQGYAVASLNYRLSQHAIWPAQIEDCKAAVRWLRAHATEYNLDPNRFAAWGPSAGGHLVAMLGTAGHVQDFEVGEHLDVSSRVQCVVDYFGPTDFLQMDAQRPPDGMIHNAPDSPESELVGGNIQEHPDKVARANPITYVTADVPPMLVVHGDADPLVPYGQSVLLVDALQAVGAAVTFYTVQGGGHGRFTDPEVPSLTKAFLDKHLRA